MALVNAGDGSVSAQYEYGPFGEPLRQTGGTLAKANPFRFSTKYQDDETDLFYYGYRFYSPSVGRWLSRDPINEFGFKLLTGKGGAFDLAEETVVYCFVQNDPISKLDIGGLITSSRLREPYEPSWKGKPCCACARHPCTFKGRLVDNGSERGVYRMKVVDFERTGCCPQSELVWTTCQRSDAPLGGPIHECDNQKECNFPRRSAGGSYRIILYARYLSCEKGTWTAHPEENIAESQCEVVNGKWMCIPQN
jgi:RHS repeat-associated protein